MDDMSIMLAAYKREHDPKDPRADGFKNWEAYAVGATREDIRRLEEGGFVALVVNQPRLKKYHLTQKGNDVVWSATMEEKMKVIPAASIMEALSLIIGFDDLKEQIADAIERRLKVNFLLQGKPACAKSLILEGVRAVTPDRNYLAFGSRTSSAGLSDALFEHQPDILLLDEADKMDHDCYSVLLGLMESGEIIETKAQKTRGIKLSTMVIAACNSSEKMPKEFLSRFVLHAHFPEYTRDEFIDVCRGFLTRAEGCPVELAELLGTLVYDNQIGDVRKARGAWQLMKKPTLDEAKRVIALMIKYSTDPPEVKKKKTTQMTMKLG